MRTRTISGRADRFEMCDGGRKAAAEERWKSRHWGTERDSGKLSGGRLGEWRGRTDHRQPSPDPALFGSSATANDAVGPETRVSCRTSSWQQPAAAGSPLRAFRLPTERQEGKGGAEDTTQQVARRAACVRVMPAITNKHGRLRYVECMLYAWAGRVRLLTSHTLTCVSCWLLADLRNLVKTLRVVHHIIASPLRYDTITRVAHTPLSLTTVLLLRLASHGGPACLLAHVCVRGCEPSCSEGGDGGGERRRWPLAEA